MKCLKEKYIGITKKANLKEEYKKYIESYRPILVAAAFGFVKLQKVTLHELDSEGEDKLVEFETWPQKMTNSANTEEASCLLDEPLHSTIHTKRSLFIHSSDVAYCTMLILTSLYHYLPIGLPIHIYAYDLIITIYNNMRASPCTPGDIVFYIIIYRFFIKYRVLFSSLP